MKEVDEVLHRQRRINRLGTLAFLWLIAMVVALVVYVKVREPPDGEQPARGSKEEKVAEQTPPAGSDRDAGPAEAPEYVHANTGDHPEGLLAIFELNTPANLELIGEGPLVRLVGGTEPLAMVQSSWLTTYGDARLRIALFDPKGGNPMVFLGRHLGPNGSYAIGRAAEKMPHGELAIGDPDKLEALRPFLESRPPRPVELGRFTLYPEALARALVVREARRKGVGYELRRLYKDAPVIYQLLGQVQSIEVEMTSLRVVGGVDRERIDRVRLRPTRGSGLAELVRHQQPARFGLLGRLPGGRFRMEAQLDAGAAGPAIIAAVVEVAAIYGGLGRTDQRKLGSALAQLGGQMTGRVGYAMAQLGEKSPEADIGDLSAWVIGVRDREAGERDLLDLVGSWAAGRGREDGPRSSRSRLDLDVGRVAGAAVARLTSRVRHRLVGTEPPQVYARDIAAVSVAGVTEMPAAVVIAPTSESLATFLARLKGPRPAGTPLGGTRPVPRKIDRAATAMAQHHGAFAVALWNLASLFPGHSGHVVMSLVAREDGYYEALFENAQ